ncbi:MAG: L-threonylcarbamoyladenylate synthase [Pirellulales bacterium]
MVQQPELITDPMRAAEILRSGGLIAFPTETVYGLGVDASNEQAVKRLFAAKGRPGNNPLIVHVADRDQVQLAAADVSDEADKLLARFAPGPITVVLPKLSTISKLVTAGLDTVGVRIPAHEAARDMLAAAARPIAAPSANKSGRPSCTTTESVLEDFGNEIDGILIGAASDIGLESTEVDCTRRPPKLLRTGGISLSQLRSVVPDLLGPTQSLEPGENSPGRLHPHYQPQAGVIVVDDMVNLASNASAAVLCLTTPWLAERFGWVRVFRDSRDYAQHFYESLREVDRRGLATVYCENVMHGELHEALRDRLARAAEPRANR